MKFNKIVVMIMALALMLCCFASCDQSGGGTTEGPQMIKVNIAINDANGDPFLLGNDFEVAVGSTVHDAAVALITARDATYTENMSDMFETITYGDVKVEGATENLANGNVKMTYFAWSYNGTRSDKLTSAQVLSDGDSVVFYFVTEEITPDTK